jgi:hypothetical protein
MMWQLKNLSRLLFAALILGCSPAPDTIAEGHSGGIHFPSSTAQLVRSKLSINELSPELVEKSVRIEGTVQQHAPLLEGTLYQLSDPTGEVWIFSLEAPPEIGMTVLVEGILQYEQIIAGGIDIGEYYLQEQSRSLLDSPQQPN